MRLRAAGVRRGMVGAAMLLAPLLLAGCGSVSVPFFGSKSKSAPAQSCPVAAVLRPLANTAVFGPAPERRPINVAYYGILSDVSATCSQSGGALRVALDIVIAAERAPAGTGTGVDLNYFVALTGPNNQVLNKTPFTVHVPVAATAKRGGVTDHVEEVIDTGGQPVATLNLVVGFQQTPDVVDFYKNYRGR